MRLEASRDTVWSVRVSYIVTVLEKESVGKLQNEEQGQETATVKMAVEVLAAAATVAATSAAPAAAFSGKPLNRVVFTGGVMGSPKVNLTAYDLLYLPLSNLPHQLSSAPAAP